MVAACQPGGSSTTHLVVDDCQFVENRSANGGAAFIVRGAEATVTNCEFIDNHADELGGAYYGWGDRKQFFGCNFTGNTAASGGAIYWEGGAVSFEISDCRIESNSALADGGGIQLQTVTAAVLDRVCLAGNQAGHNGGAVHVTSEGIGPGGAYWYPSDVKLTNCALCGNSAGASGGAIHNELAMDDRLATRVRAHQLYAGGQHRRRCRWRYRQHRLRRSDNHKLRPVEQPGQPRRWGELPDRLRRRHDTDHQLLRRAGLVRRLWRYGEHRCRSALPRSARR